MKKTAAKMLAILLAVVMTVTPAFNASALNIDDRQVKTVGAHLIDDLLDLILDPLINLIVKNTMSADSLGRKYKTAEEYLSEEQEYFYGGTGGRQQGSGWKLGYASAGVIPEKWRRDADGNRTPDGMCLNRSYYFGGYFGSKVDKIYDDERINLAVLSAGTDKNGNGVEDVLIVAVLDNIGFANGNVRKVREAVAGALAGEGVDGDDIIGFEFSCTHAHTVIEALGMSLNTVFFKAMINHFLYRNDTAVAGALMDSICSRASECAASAYKGMKKGTLSYFRTENLTDYMNKNAVNKDDPEAETVRDKNEYGAACRQTLSCWCFEADDGEKTVIGNGDMHPTFAGRSSKRVCADFPHYLNLAMQEMGYNFIFVQGTQAAIGLRGFYTAEGEKWAEKKTLSYEDWVQRYGKEYADENYADEQDYFEMKATGYSLAQAITASVGKKTKLSPVIDVKMKQIAVPLDYDVMYLGAVPGVFGYNTVTMDESETGYGIVTEIGYVELGDKVAVLMLPGEVSPAITYGKAASYNGTDSWSGTESWSGEDWSYKTLEQMAKEKLGNDVIIDAAGLANDEIGYVMPATDCAKNFLTKSVTSFLGYNLDRSNNEELMMACSEAGECLTLAYADFFGTPAK